jgi:hypothetical protein
MAVKDARTTETSNILVPVDNRSVETAGPVATETSPSPSKSPLALTSPNNQNFDLKTQTDSLPTT